MPYDAWYLSTATESDLVARLQADGFRKQPHQDDGSDDFVKDDESVTIFLNTDLDVDGETIATSAGERITIVYRRPKSLIESLYWKLKP